MLLLQPMVASPPAIDWTLVALTVWLVGAMVFLTRRYGLYFAMRSELLRDGAEVGTREGVRLVETPATKAPLAFGVIDKVIALPPGFLAETDTTRRDLALEHELAHHRAHDLLANALVQPLFALHWFNPLGWVGWRAMRRDQEAACDARVVARCDADLREAYATTIASFATGRGAAGPLALAAPMACLVLGDKSIIHRLRNLTMSDISPRRRIAARIAMIGALAALPLTASISYAESLVVPEAPPAPAAPAAPAAPDAASVTVPNPPAAPGAPEAPEAPEPPEVFVLSDKNGEGKQVVQVERKVVTDGSGQRRAQTRYVVNGREATAQERAQIEAGLEGLSIVSGDMDRLRLELRTMRENMGEDSEWSREMERLRKRLGEGGDLHRQIEEARRKLGESRMAERETRIALARVATEMPEFRYDCDGSDQIVQERAESDGKKVIIVCRSAGLATARSAIATARSAVQRDRNLSERERAEALRALEEAMREVESAN